jgi:hypothetical protein
MAAHGPRMVPRIAKSARGYDRRPVVRPCNVSEPHEMLENTRANRPHADSRRACALPISMITLSATGKHLSGVNARRRKQAAKRIAISGPATYRPWLRQDIAPMSQEAFNRLRAELNAIKWDGGLDPRVVTIPVTFYVPQHAGTISSP